MNGLWVLLIVVASWLGCWLWLLWGRRRLVLDMPNQRSAHQQPVVRGGGVVFISLFLGCAGWFLSGSEFPWLQYCLAVLLVMLVGFADDLHDLSALSRLLVQLGAAILLVQPMWSESMQTLPAAWSAATSVLLVFALVWLINLYNFMDGIDGIAALEALSVCAVLALLCWLGGHWLLFNLCLVLGAAVFGFLWWNLPTARLFMGDAGSGGLGTAFAVLLVISASVDSRLVWSCFLLLSVFIVDTSWTLAVRLFTGHKIWLAHNLHAYQKLSRRVSSHLKVSMAVTFYNLLWLGPVTLGFYFGYLDLVVAWALCWCPILLLCYRVRAGQIERR